MESEHTLHPIDPYQDKADPWSSHSVILAMLRDFPIGTRILDVGTATGIVGRMCSGLGFVLRGVEPVARWAEASRPYYDAIATSDLANTADEFLRGHQVVICADVLEHMADPQEQLRRLVDLQQNGTIFLISLPNIANIWVRVNLLFGRFSYADRGILDRTHLRFFTLHSAKALLSQVGLQVITTVTTPIPLNLIHPFFINHPIGRGLHSSLAALTRMLPRLWGYQFVFRAIKEIE